MLAYHSFDTFLGNTNDTGLVMNYHSSMLKANQDDLYPAFCEGEIRDGCNIDSVGDGWCDGYNNKAICFYDGGDCCQGEGRGFTCGEDSNAAVLALGAAGDGGATFNTNLFSGCDLPEKDFVQPCNECHAEMCTCHTTQENYCSGYQSRRLSCENFNNPSIDYYLNFVINISLKSRVAKHLILPKNWATFNATTT